MPKKIMKLFAYGAFHAFAALYAVVLILGVPALTGQQRSAHDEVTEIRVAGLEEKIKGFEALGLDRRMAVMESILADLRASASKSDYAAGGVGLLILRAIYEEITRRKKSGGGE